ncbi:hypothetical protein MaudCBS49596_002218 [Microsporum audouinii]
MPRSLTIKQIEGKPGQVYCPLQLNEVPKPVPGPGEVLVKIHAAALNHQAFFVRQHLYPGISFTSPLLCDGCGTVVEVGPDCTVAASTMFNKLVILLPCLGWDSKFDGPEDMAKYAIIGARNRYPHGAAQGYIVVRESENIDINLLPTTVEDLQARHTPADEFGNCWGKHHLFNTHIIEMSSQVREDIILWCDTQNSTT